MRKLIGTGGWERKCERIAKRAAKELTDFPVIGVKLLLECWNAETPHFGGAGPHRYDDNDKYCCYCRRPKNWKGCNPGVVAGFLPESEE